LALDQRGHGDSEWDRSAHPEYNYDRYAADLHGCDHHVTLDNPRGFVEACKRWIACLE